MTKEEILKHLHETKAIGLSYKGIAQQAGLRPQDIYDYMKRLTPMTRVHTALEKYFTKEVDI
jgi:hypothetical protein